MVFLKIMLFSTRQVIGIFLHKIHSQPAQISGSANGGQLSKDHINLHHFIGPVKSYTLFHVIDVQTSYHVLLRHPWIHQYKVIPSSFHQHMKIIQNNELVTIPISTSPFKEHESYMTSQLSLMRVTFEGEVTPFESLQHPF